MKKALHFITAIIFFIVPIWGITQTCPTDIIFLSSQADVDNFATTYDVVNCNFSGGISINGPDIINLDGLSGLNSVAGNLSINGNDILNDISGLSGITSVGEGVTIENNNTLTEINSLSFPALTTVGYLQISDNPSLTNINGFLALSSVSADLYIERNPVLANVNGLSALASIGGPYLLIDDNPLLTDISGLSNLNSISGFLQIFNNISLSNLIGLSGLSTIDGNLEIINNAALTNLNELSGLTSITGDLIIKNNAALSECDIEAVCDATVVTGTTTIVNNSGNCFDNDNASFACIPSQNLFITKWQTTTDIESITIPTSAEETYNYTVNWGDGDIVNEYVGDATHTYAVPGIYTVSIIGTFPRIFFNRGTNRGINTNAFHNLRKILSIEQWGNNNWSSMNAAFRGCTNLNVVATDLPDLSNVQSMTRMFEECSSLIGNASFNDWNVSNVSTMDGLFYGASSFNQAIGNWNVNNVTYMPYMFKEATIFNQPIENWVVSNVTSMALMFVEAHSFNQPLDNWNVSGVTEMHQMFMGALAFDQPLNTWTVSSVTNMSEMFSRALSFNQPLDAWDVATVYNMASMFIDASSFNQNLGEWDVSSLESSAWYDEIFGNYVADEASAVDMFKNAGLSTENYDALLIGWGTLDTDAGETQIPNGITLNAGNSLYCDGEAIREDLETNFGWIIQDSGKDPNCAADIEGPEITCPPTIVEFAPEGEFTIPVGITELPIVTDNFSSQENITITGERSDGGPLPEGDNLELFPVSNVIITWTATDEAGNTSSCEQLVSIAFEGNSGSLDQNGALTLSDGTADADDNYTLSVSEGNLVIGSTAGIRIFGNGVVQVDANTVHIPLSGITNGLTLDGGGGSNTLNLDTSLALLGSTNGLTLNKLNIQLTGTGNMQLNALNVSNGNFDTNGLTTTVITEANFFGASTLSGIGTIVGTVNMGVDANLNPGTSPGILNTGNLVLDNNNNNFEVNGPSPGTEHDQVVVTGTVTIQTGTTLNLLGGYANIETDEIILISNDGSDAITGTFAGLTEGDAVSFGGFTGTISYTGGDGNDISLNGVPAQRPFVTTWKTDNPGTSNNSSITVPTTGTGYNYDVDWDNDGTYDEFGLTGNATHDYVTAGTYTVAIRGDFPRIYFNNSGDAAKILTVEQWGDIAWSSMENAFTGCSGLDMVASDTPDLSIVLNLARMFEGCVILEGNVSINNWDVSSVRTMNRMFYNAQQFNADISSWNVQQVTSMFGMFQQASSFNQNIGNWNVSSVLSMNSLFQTAGSFNQDIGNWDVSSVQSMNSMFNGANAFNQDIGNWDVGMVVSLSSMFASAGTDAFNQDLGSWDVSSVENMQNMFLNNNSFNGDITTWDVSSVTNMESMFQNTALFNQDISKWDVSNVTNMRGMFNTSSSFDQNLADWDISSVNNLINMFAATALSTDNYDATLTGWATLDAGETQIPQNITFDGGNSLYCDGAAARQSLIDGFGWTITDGGLNCPVSNAFITTWKTDNPGTSNSTSITIPTTGMGYSYDVDWENDGTYDQFDVTGNATHDYGTAGTYTVAIRGVFPRIFFNLNGDREKIMEVNQWGNNQWTNMDSAFEGCSNLNVVAFDSPDLSNVLSLKEMFRFCTSLVGTTSFDNWQTGTIVNMSRLFNNATSFNQLIGSWDTSSVTDFNNMFQGAVLFNQTIGNWNTTASLNMSGFFSGATSFNQPIGGWETGQVNTMRFMFSGASAFNQPIGDWDTSKVTHTGSMFSGAVSFDQDISQWNTTSVTSMASMFQRAESFNQPIGLWNTGEVAEMDVMFQDATLFDQAIQTWNMSKVTNIRIMFDGATNFNQPLGDWDISNIQDAQNFLTNSGLSTNNYDLTLIGWATLDTNSGETQIPSNITFDGGNSLFCTSESQRQDLITNFGWTITDGGLNCSDNTSPTMVTIDPIDDALGVAVDAILTITFDEDIQWQSEVGVVRIVDVLTDNQFQGFTSSTTSAVISENVLTLNPPEDFVPNTEYKILIGNDSFEDLSGNPFAGIAVDAWTFTTEAQPAIPFITTWKTDNPGTSNSTSITIPTAGGGYFYDVDWDNDGTYDEFDVTGDVTHDYGTVGTYTVAIRGDFPRIFFNSSGDKEKILTVIQWGSIEWQSMEGAFMGCASLDVQAIDSPDLSGVSSMEQMFQDSFQLIGTTAFANWDVSSVVNMANLFGGTELFNQDISSWDVSNVMNMNEMFFDTSVFNQDIGSWDVSSVTSLEGTFLFAQAFNQDINGWNVSSVVSTNSMFFGSVKFDQSLSDWNIESIVDMNGMFGSGSLSSENYDDTLSGWASLATEETQIPQNITFEGGNSQYCTSETDRQNLIDTFGWTITDAGKDPLCGVDIEGPEIPCPPTIVEFAPEGEFQIPITIENPTATDNVSAPGDIIITGVRSDGGPLDGGDFDLFPIHNVTITWTATDEAGNTSSCEQLVSVAYEGGGGNLDENGTLTVTDSASETDDDYTISLNGTNLVLQSTAGIQIFGNGVVQVNANTVEIPLENITDGLTINGQGGNNTLTLAGPMALLGANNGLNLNNLNVQLSGTGDIQLNELNVNNGVYDTNGLTTIVDNGANFFGNATLGGTGSISGAITMNLDSNLAPGTSPGILNTGNLVLEAGSVFDVEVNGPTPGTEHDQVIVTGTVTINGASLNLISGYANAPTDEVILIDNDGTDSVTGIFVGLAEGDVVTFGGFNGFISYVGGDGNDVSLIGSLDVTAPTAVFNPATETSLLPVDQVFTVTFDELVQITDTSGEITIFNLVPSGGASTVDVLTIANGGIQLTDDGTVSTLTLTPTQNLPGNKVLTFDIPSGLFEDLSGNTWTGISGFSTVWRTSTGLGDTPCTSGAIDLEIIFDDFPDETSWQLTDQGGNIVASADYLNQGQGPNTTITDQFTNLVDGTYTFTMFDAFGDGICCGFGQGAFTVSKNGIEIFNGGQFLTTQPFQFCIDGSIDAELPVITCPSGIELNAGTSCSSMVTLTEPTAIDNVSTAFTFEGVRSDERPLTDPFFIGNTTITWTATDEAGNVSESCSQIITVNSTGDCWFNAGFELVGDAEMDLGAGVTINAAGDIAAYVNPSSFNSAQPGTATVLKFENGTWNVLGNTVPGGQGRGGSGIDLNDEGNRLAVSQLNGNVQVYELINGNWQQLGIEIIAVGQIFIQKVDFDASGNRLVIGYSSTVNNIGGLVVVYELQNGQWTQLGDLLEGNALGDHFGRDVSLNADGTRLAVGAYQVDKQSYGLPRSGGYAQVFELVNGNWQQLGNDLVADGTQDFFGISVGLNDIGNRLVVGANAGDYAKIFQFENGNWEQLGNTITAELPIEQTGYQVDINGFGDIVLIGDVGQPGKVFQLVNNQWQLLGQPIYANVGQDVAINKAGDKLILGTPPNFNILGRGKVAIFEYTGALIETQIILDANGALTILDTNGGDTNDNFTLSLNGGNLRISNSASINISGSGVVQIDLNTVEIPLSSITNGIALDGAAGGNTLLIDSALNLTGPDNGLTLNNIDVTITDGVDVQLNALQVNNGSFDTTGSVITVATAANFDTNTTLSGTGTIIGVVNMNIDSNLAPGVSPGILATGDLVLNSGSALDAEVNGPTPGTEHDQIVVSGTVTIDGASLNLLGGYANGPTDEIIVIANDGADAIIGTFDGLAEGAEVNFGGFNGIISYVGGDGNDVVLRNTVSETAITSFELIEGTFLQGTDNPSPTGPILRAEQGKRVVYMKFDLGTLGGPITKAQLKMQVASDPGTGTLEVFLGSSSGWTETGLNGSNKPTEVGSALASITGTHSLGQMKVWDLDVGRLPNGGLVTLIVKHSNGNDVAFASDETNQAPQLIITSAGANGPIDADGDGFDSDVDCNDNNPAIHPGAIEVCDGVDNNCDGWIDDQEPFVTCNSVVEGPADLIDATFLQGNSNPSPTGPILRAEQGNRVVYMKFDLGTLGGPMTQAQLKMQVASDPGTGTLQVFLGSSSNWTESGLNGSNKPTEVGSALATITGTHSIGQTKVWDLDIGRLPNGGLVTLIVKHSNGNDVAFASDETDQAPQLIITSAGANGPIDADGDGFDSDVDCDDSNPSIHPDALEICDGVDNNCDGLIDDQDPFVTCNSVEGPSDLIDATFLQGSSNPSPTGPILRTEQGNRVTYLKFDLNNEGPITKAQLKMQVASDPGSGTLQVFLGSSSGWTEAGLNGSNKPVEVGTALATITGTHSLGQTKVWDLDVGGLPKAGLVTLIVKHSNGNDVAFASDETNQAPQLIITSDGSDKLLIKKSANTLSLSPNPATNNITARFDRPIKVKTIMVFDMIGRLVRTYKAEEVKNGDGYGLDLNFIQPGNYIIKTIDDQGNQFQKQMAIEY